MSNVLKLCQELSKGFMVIPFFRMLFYGIIFALIMTFIIGWSMDQFTVVSTFPYLTNPGHSAWMPVIFGSFGFFLLSRVPEQPKSEGRYP
jgi:hypothetical protein